MWKPLYLTSKLREKREGWNFHLQKERSQRFHWHCVTLTLIKGLISELFSRFGLFEQSSDDYGPKPASIRRQHPSDDYLTSTTSFSQFLKLSMDSRQNLTDKMKNTQSYRSCCEVKPWGCTWVLFFVISLRHVTDNKQIAVRCQKRCEVDCGQMSQACECETWGVMFRRQREAFKDKINHWHDLIRSTGRENTTNKPLYNWVSQHN